MVRCTINIYYKYLQAYDMSLLKICKGNLVIRFFDQSLSVDVIVRVRLTSERERRALAVAAEFLGGPLPTKANSRRFPWRRGRMQSCILMATQCPLSSRS